MDLSHRFLKVPSRSEDPKNSPLGNNSFFPSFNILSLFLFLFKCCNFHHGTQARLRQRSNHFPKIMCFNLANPSLFFHLFSSLQTHITIFTANKCEKCPSRIWCRDSNLRPLEHESPPITTRPGLPPFHNLMLPYWYNNSRMRRLFTR